MELTIKSVIEADAEASVPGQQIQAFGAGDSPGRVYIQFWIPASDPAYGTFTVGQVITIS